MPKRKNSKRISKSKFLKALAASGSVLTLLLALTTSVQANVDKDTKPLTTKEQSQTKTKHKNRVPTSGGKNNDDEDSDLFEQESSDDGWGDEDIDKPKSPNKELTAEEKLTARSRANYGENIAKQENINKDSINSEEDSTNDYTESFSNAPPPPPGSPDAPLPPLGSATSSNTEFPNAPPPPPGSPDAPLPPLGSATSSNTEFPNAPNVNLGTPPAAGYTPNSSPDSNIYKEPSPKSPPMTVNIGTLAKPTANQLSTVKLRSVIAKTDTEKESGTPLDAISKAMKQRGIDVGSSEKNSKNETVEEGDRATNWDDVNDQYGSTVKTNYTSAYKEKEVSPLLGGRDGFTRPKSGKYNSDGTLNTGNKTESSGIGSTTAADDKNSTTNNINNRLKSTTSSSSKANPDNKTQSTVDNNNTPKKPSGLQRFINFFEPGNNSNANVKTSSTDAVNQTMKAEQNSSSFKQELDSTTQNINNETKNIFSNPTSSESIDKDTHVSETLNNSDPGAAAADSNPASFEVNKANRPPPKSLPKDTVSTNLSNNATTASTNVVLTTSMQPDPIVAPEPVARDVIKANPTNNKASVANTARTNNLNQATPPLPPRNTNKAPANLTGAAAADSTFKTENIPSFSSDNNQENISLDKKVNITVTESSNASTTSGALTNFGVNNTTKTPPLPRYTEIDRSSGSSNPSNTAFDSRDKGKESDDPDMPNGHDRRIAAAQKSASTFIETTTSAKLDPLPKDTVSTNLSNNATTASTNVVLTTSMQPDPIVAPEPVARDVIKANPTNNKASVANTARTNNLNQAAPPLPPRNTNKAPANLTGAAAADSNPASFEVNKANRPPPKSLPKDTVSTNLSNNATTASTNVVLTTSMQPDPIVAPEPVARDVIKANPTNNKASVANTARTNNLNQAAPPLPPRNTNKAPANLTGAAAADSNPASFEVNTQVTSAPVTQATNTEADENAATSTNITQASADFVVSTPSTIVASAATSFSDSNVVPTTSFDNSAVNNFDSTSDAVEEDIIPPAPPADGAGGVPGGVQYDSAGENVDSASILQQENELATSRDDVSLTLTSTPPPAPTPSSIDAGVVPGNTIEQSQGILGIDTYMINEQQNSKIYVNEAGKPVEGNLNEKIALEVAFTDKGIDQANLTTAQKLVIGNIEKAGKKIAEGNIDQEIISSVKNLSSEFVNQVAEIAASDKFANEKSKEMQALANYIAQSKLGSLERASAEKTTKQQMQNFINVNKESVTATNASINARMLSIASNSIRTGESSGVAAGDEHGDIGLGTWVSGIYGTSEKGSNNDEAGYSGKLTGGSAGADFGVRDNTILGVAYSYVASSFKYKSSRMGDKVDAISNIFSLYGKSELNDNIIWQGIFSASFSKVKNKRIEHFNNKAAEAKFNSNSYIIDNNLGYKFDIDEDVSITPNIGVRYSYFKDSKHKETGVGTFNRIVDKTSSSELAGTVGTKFTVTKKFDSGLKITSGLHVSAENILNSKQQKIKAKLGWMNDYFENTGKGAKPPPTTFNVGGNVVAQKGNIEVSASYNYNFHKKYRSHQGALKLKIMF